MKWPVLALACLLALSGCGNDPGSNDYGRPAKALLARITSGSVAAPTLATLDAAGIATLRAALEQDRQPIYLVMNPKLKYITLMAPFGQNGDVQTWASTQYETLSLRDGLLVATRGFGPDLMSSSGPGIARIAGAQGATQRQYFYLDGADQKAAFSYDCTLSPAGNETVTVLGKAYATRKVVETCTGAAGRFENLFWFDHGHNLRQSSQRIAPVLDNLLLQRIID